MMVIIDNIVKQIKLAIQDAQDMMAACNHDYWEGVGDGLIRAMYIINKQKGDGGDMEYKNNEGYPDPTAGKAIRAADRMPTHIYNAYCVINNVAGLLGLEITGLRDKKSGKEWNR